MSRKLQAVTDHPARRGRPKTLLTSASGGSEREMLVVLRQRLAAKLDEGDVPMHALAQLIRQFRDVDREIRAIDARAAQAARPGGGPARLPPSCDCAVSCNAIRPRPRCAGSPVNWPGSPKRPRAKPPW